eukprot:snap_masked-scaffold_20-processed-gene-5.84-mRNA-1 protein AED:1.00 eAED:1.00 QI:0/-1/0/0/-1/1/1/0/446
MTSGLQTTAYILFFISVSIVIFSLLLWLRHYKHQNLQVRSTPLMLLFSYAILINIFEQHLNKATFSNYVDSNFTDWKLLHKCEFEVFHSISYVPIILLTFALRLHRWKANVKYNQKLAEFFEQKNKFDIVPAFDNHLVLSEATEIRRVRNLKSEKHLLKLAVFGLILITIYAAIIAYFSCPSSGNCLYNDNSTESVINLSLNLIPSLLFFGMLFYTRKQLKTYPDPLNLLREMQQLILIPTFAAVVYIVLRVSDPFGVNDENGKTSFSYAIVIDVSFLVAFIIFVSIPAIKTYQSKFKTYAQEAETYSLTEILDNSTGMKLFKNHLIFEFSVENLYFYLTAKEWKAGFEKNALRRDYFEEEAKTIYKRYLQEGAANQVNLGFSEVDKILKRIEKGEISLTLFDEVVYNIFVLMSQDSFSRFKETKTYKEFVGLGAEQFNSSFHLSL